MARLNDKALDIVGVDAAAFKSEHAGRVAEPMSPVISKQVAGLFAQHGAFGSAKVFTATSAERDAFNDKAASNAKTAQREAPEPLTTLGLAQRNARSAAYPFRRYADAEAEAVGKSASLRLRNNGNDDTPQVTWAYVLVDKRAPRKSKSK